MGGGKSIYEIIALILVGIGFFLYGMEIVAGAIKLLSGHHARKLLARWTGKQSVGMLFGFLSGAISQSGSKASLIMANLMASRLITLRNAIPIVAAANLGTVLIVFLVSIDIKLATLYFLAIFLLVFAFGKTSGGKPLIHLFLGIGLLLFGFLTLQSGAKPLLAIPAIQQMPAHMGGAAFFAWLPFLIGLAMRILAQSTSAVIVIALTFLHAGGLDINQAMFLVFGAIMGSGISTWLMGAKLKGSSRQLALLQVVYDASSSLIMTALALIEVTGHLPLVMAATGHLAADANQQLAFVYLGARMSGFCVTLAFRNRITSLLERIAPPSQEEQLSKPEYLFDDAAQDPLSALPLVEKEQQRILRRLPIYLEPFREEHDTPDYPAASELHHATRELCTEVRNFLTESMRQDISRDTAESLLRLQKRQDLLMLAEENLHAFVSTLHSWNGGSEAIQHVRGVMVESLHANLTIAADAAESGAQEEIAQVITITDDKSNLMEKLREESLSGDHQLNAAERASFLRVTDLYQRMIWLLNQWALAQTGTAVS